VGEEKLIKRRRWKIGWLWPFPLDFLLHFHPPYRYQWRWFCVRLFFGDFYMPIIIIPLSCRIVQVSFLYFLSGIGFFVDILCNITYPYVFVVHCAPTLLAGVCYVWLLVWLWLAVMFVCVEEPQKRKVLQYIVLW